MSIEGMSEQELNKKVIDDFNFVNDQWIAIHNKLSKDVLKYEKDKETAWRLMGRIYNLLSSHFYGISLNMTKETIEK